MAFTRTFLTHQTNKQTTHGIHITVGYVMLDVIYVAVVDYGFKRTEMPNLPSAAMVYPAADNRLTLLLEENLMRT
jgi:heme/copper-type cytochrome/quinol oxidase subunit 3